MKKWVRHSRNAVGYTGAYRIDLGHPLVKGMVAALGFSNQQTMVGAFPTSQSSRPYRVGYYDATYRKRGRYGPTNAGAVSTDYASQYGIRRIPYDGAYATIAGVFMCTGATAMTQRVTGLADIASWGTFYIVEGNGTTGGIYGKRYNISNVDEYWGGDNTVSANEFYFAVATTRPGAQDLWVDGKKSASPGTFNTNLKDRIWFLQGSTGSGRYAGPSFLWDRVLSDGEIAALSENPYQLFRNDGAIFYSLPLLSTAQKSRPVSDITTGGWLPSSGADLYAMIDEAA